MNDFNVASKNVNVSPATLNVKLQDAATATGNGTAINVYGKSTVGIQIYGTSTSATVIFEGSVDTASDTTLWVAIPGCKYDVNYPIATSSAVTSAPNEIWDVSCKGLAQVRARISAIANGNISILALGVA